MHYSNWYIHNKNNNSTRSAQTFTKANLVRILSPDDFSVNFLVQRHRFTKFSQRSYQFLHGCEPKALSRNVARTLKISKSGADDFKKLISSSLSTSLVKFSQRSDQYFYIKYTRKRKKQTDKHPVKHDLLGGGNNNNNTAEYE